MTVRTRVAPSPTGDPHVGTAYVALFNYCFARMHGGQFILRVEDTDRARSTSESEALIMEALRWVGLEWDEGPDVGGAHGPYRQSERGEIYAKYAQQLLDGGHAFRCFHTPEELAAMRKASQGQPGRRGMDSEYEQLSAAESEAKVAEGLPFVVRLKVPREGTCVVNDLLRGEIEIEWAQVDQQVLLKSDGMPTYHLANVVDDHLMEITHVIRGEEWISSAPKHLALYEAFAWEAPTLCHLPLLRNPDKSKLSKRKNPTSIIYYQRMGYLPEALLNYLGRMAWSMPDEAEKFSLAQMIEHFDLSRISLGGPVFDVTKLGWLNSLYLRDDLDDRALADAIKTWALNEDYLMPVLPLIRQRIQKFSDIAGMAAFFLQGDELGVTAEDLAHPKLSPEELVKTLRWSLWHLEGATPWNAETIEAALRDCAELCELKLRDYLKPFFVGLTGQKSSTPLFDTMAILGRDVVRSRLRKAMELLGGLSKKKEAKVRKAYDAALRARAEASAEG